MLSSRLMLVLVVFLTLSQISWLGSVSNGPAIQPAIREVAAAPTYTLEGTLNIIYGDAPHGSSFHGKTIYILSMANGTNVMLDLASPPPFSYARKHVIVTGDELKQNTLQNGHIETVMTGGKAALPTGIHAGITPMIGTQKVILLLLEYSDDTSTPHDPSYYTTLINGVSGDAVNAVYLAQSWNQLGFQADVAGSGWMTLPHTKSFYAPCGWTGICANLMTLTNDGIALALGQGVNFALYDSISFVLSNDLDCCAWGGSVTGTLSSVTKTWEATWEPPWSQEPNTYAHELGHSLGLPHSGWVYYDYDNPWDIMSDTRYYPVNGYACGSYSSKNDGGATDGINCYHPSGTIAAYRDALGWIPAPNVHTVLSYSDANDQVESLDSPLTTNMKMMKICMYGYSCASGGDTSRYLTVEVRTSYGYDQYLPTAGPGVIISMFQGDRSTISGPCYFISDNPPAYPIDHTPGDYNSVSCAHSSGIFWPNYALGNAQWGDGQTYSDHSKLGPRTLTIVSHTTSSTPPSEIRVYTIHLDIYTAPLALAQTSVIGATASSVIFVLPDGTAGHAKPPGVGAALLSDWTALGFMFGTTDNNQIMAMDTNSTYFNTATGQPIVTGKVLVLFAGPLVNGVVNYYEKNRIAPLWWGVLLTNPIQAAWLAQDGAIAAQLSSTPLNAGTQDMFLIEYFQDTQTSNTIFIIYGFGWRGTFAGGVFFKTNILPNIAGYAYGWYIYRWTDTNANGLPDPYEVNTIPVAYEAG